MPELPEVEHLRRSLAPLLVGRRIERVELRRPDVLSSGTGGTDGSRSSAAHRLLLGGTICGLERRGKQLGIFAADGRALVVQLGMTGTLVRSSATAAPDRHTHIIWHAADGATLAFRDPRRFGGVRAFPDSASVRRHWATELGPDAISVRAEELAEAFGASRRAVKAALLDQQRLAGVGNIYADEALFRSGIAPGHCCFTLREGDWSRLAAALRSILAEAVEAGGSSIRDYKDGTGQRGRYAAAHAVYGRAGQRCVACGSVLRSTRLAQRTTCFCPTCQPASRNGAYPQGRKKRLGVPNRSSRGPDCARIL